MFVDEFCWQRQGVPGDWKDRFKNSWEPVFHFGRQGAPIRFRPENVLIRGMAIVGGDRRNRATGSGFGARTETAPGFVRPSNVIVSTVSTESFHSAAFPVALPEFFVKAFSDPGDAVLDPFMGSGTTLIACEKTGRISRGVEISEAYCDVIVERWQTFTGKKAKRVRGAVT